MKKNIAPMVTGNGMYMELNDNKIHYVHWDDPKELVDRLRLLPSLTSARHTGHTNGINSIMTSSSKLALLNKKKNYDPNIKIQIVEEIQKPARIHFKRRKTIIKSLDDLFQVDLVEMIS